MSLLKPSQPSQSKTINVEGNILSRAEQYQQFAGLESFDDMVNQSLDFVMKKDKDFNKKYPLK